MSSGYLIGYVVVVTANHDQAEYDPTEFPPFAVTVDMVVFTIDDDRLRVVVIEPGDGPAANRWALPGGFVRADEDIEPAAWRVLRTKTGVTGTDHLAQLGTYGAPDRDPRMRVVTVAWWAIIPDLPEPVPGRRVEEARLVDVDDVVDASFELAFDHRTIVADALDAARSEIELTAVAASFLDEQFRISDLRQVYETIWGLELEPGNFQRKVRGLKGFIEPTGHRSSESPSGRPAELFTCNDVTAKLAVPFRHPDSRSDA